MISFDGEERQHRGRFDVVCWMLPEQIKWTIVTSKLLSRARKRQAGVMYTHSETMRPRQCVALSRRLPSAIFNWEKWSMIHSAFCVNTSSVFILVDGFSFNTFLLFCTSPTEIYDSASGGGEWVALASKMQIIFALAFIILMEHDLPFSLTVYWKFYILCEGLNFSALPSSCAVLCALLLCTTMN